MELNIGVMVSLLFAGLLVMLLSGVEVAFGLIAVGLIAMYAFLPLNSFGDAARQAWDQLNSSSLSAVVMYIFMGELILKAGISEGIFKSLNRWLGGLAGGLLHSVTGACTFFAAISGSSVACAASVGSVAIPTIKQRGYNPRLIFGAIVGGGALGILIPPSIIMILYGSLSGVSIAQCFIGGIVPGVLLALMYVGYNYFMVKLDPSLAPVEAMSETFGERLRGSIDLLPLLGLAGLLMGGIYLGFFTPTEAAGIGCALTFLIVLGYGKLSWALVRESSSATIHSSSMIFMILAGAALVSYVVNYLKIPTLLVEWVVAIGIGKYTVLLLVFILLFILGCLIDGISICIILVPVLYPLMMELGFDPIWFGIMLTICIEIGLLTPPFGMNLFVVKGIDPTADFKDIVMGAVPYVIMMTLMVLFITIFPEIATWLPNMMKT
jgi:tripartite ATP-independent transporter DctM subunit